MDPFHDGQSDIGRSSRRGSLRFSMADASAADDSDIDSHFDLAEATVLDGFRPVRASQVPSRQSQSSPAPPQPPGSAHNPVLPSSERPSSAIKPQGLPDSTTDAPQLRPQSPYRGPSAPSHPYQSYLQRTISNATSSTSPAATEHSYHGARGPGPGPGPAHPYGQYTQSVAPHHGDDISQHRDAYQRQLGPDGEEGGLVGPLGHREELPPYSRYPSPPLARKAIAPVGAAATATASLNEGLETSPEAAAAAAAAAVATRQLAVPGAGGIGVATLNPEFSATEEDMGLSRSHPSIESRHEINTAARDIAEKPPLNKWQRRAKKKLWGIIPCWAICMVLVVLLLMVIILAAVIGTVLSHRNNHAPYPETTAVTMPDVVPLPTPPADLRHLESGCYSLPPFLAAQKPQDCVADGSQSSAWNCDVSSWAYLINITHHSDNLKTKAYDFTLTATGLAGSLMWGMQPFQLKSPTQLTLVNDVFDKRYGPAWWSTFSYDKTVILTADSLNANDDTQKRWHHQQIQDRVRDDSVTVTENVKTSSVLQDGDICWLCSWPETTVEIFIYPNQAITPSLPTTTGHSGQNTAYPTYPAYPTYGSSAAVPTGLPTGLPPTLPIPVPAGFNMTLPRPMYPKAVKFVERRHSKPSNKASCRKVEVINGGKDFRNLTHNDKPIVLDIMEIASPLKPQQAKLGWHEERDSYELTQCACLWWL